MFGQILKNMSWVMRHLEKSVGSCGFSETICFLQQNSCIFRIIKIYENQIFYKKTIIFWGKNSYNVAPQKAVPPNAIFGGFF